MSEPTQLIVLLLILLAVFLFCAVVDWWFVKRPVKRMAEREAKEDLRPIYGPEQPPIYFLGYLGKNTRMLFSSGSRSHPENYIPVWGTEPLQGD